MNQIAATFLGLGLFMLQLIIAQYVIRILAIKFHKTGPGQGLAALFF